MKFSTQTCFFALCLWLQAGFSYGDQLKVNGFIAQGVIQANESNFVTDDGEPTLKLTEIGINSSYRINSSLRVAGQGVYLNGGNRYSEGLRVDYLFLDWQLLNTADWQIKLKLGRNKNYHWLYSATRDVPHTRPSIILPQSLYFDVFRDVALGVDGVVLNAQTNNDLGEWDLNFSYGNSNISEEQKKNLLGSFSTGKLKHTTDNQFSLFWRPHLTNVQLGFTLLDADFRYTQGENDPLFDGDETSQRIMFNLLYQGQYWEIASELMREKVKATNIIFPGFYTNTTAEGGYIQSRYLGWQDVVILARLDMYDRDRKDRNGSNYLSLSQGAVPRYFGFMDQATLGITWKFAEHVQLQAEYHKVKGTGRLAPIFTPDVLLNSSKYWDMWAVQLMYWF